MGYINFELGADFLGRVKNIKINTFHYLLYTAFLFLYMFFLISINLVKLPPNAK